MMPAEPAVVRVEALLVELPFWFSFGHALAARASTRNLVVGVTLTDGTAGWGEGVPREYVTGETADGALERVVHAYGPALVGWHLPTTDVPAQLRSLRDRLHDADAPPGAAWCAVETALLDAIGRATGQPAAALLGGAARPRVRYSGVAPFAQGPVLAAILGFFRVYGFAQVKLKVGQGPSRDVAAIRLARRVLGPNVALRVDANCAWTADETLEMAARLRPYGVHSFEQPVPADDVDGLSRLVRELPEDVALDESLRSVADARRLAEARAGTVFNVRVSKCGGPLAALEIVEVARAAGLRCQLGAQVGESGILSAAGRLVAVVAEPGFIAHEGSDNRFLLRRDLTREDLTVGPGGWGPALRGAGLGVTVPRVLLEEVVVRRAEVGTAWPSRRPGDGAVARTVVSPASAVR